MKTIKIKFVDFWPGFDETDNFLTRVLKKRYIIDICKKPDYLIYSVCGSTHLDYDCVKIFYTGENETPDFNLCDYAIGFDYIDFGDRYLRYPLYLLCGYENAFKLMTQKHFMDVRGSADRDFCSFVYSNANADPMRGQLLQALNSYKKVDSGGRYQNNVGRTVNDKLEFERRHKFSIACENGSHKGYITEKLVQSFASGTVPIYWGGPDVEQYFNPDAFINVGRFSDLEELVEYVKYVDQHDDVYYKMLSTPALRDENYAEDAQRKLDEFLQNIFDQEYDSAYRRDRSFWGQYYTRKMREMRAIYEHPLRHFAKILKRACCLGFSRIRRIGL